VKHWKNTRLALLLALAATGLFAAAADLLPSDQERATLIRDEILYASAGANSQTLSQVGRGTSLTILEKNNADGQPWMKVALAADQQQVTKEVTGWIPGKTVISASTGNGDQIIFGQAVDSERQAEERGGRKGAAEDALRLYSRVPELFPNSPLAVEAMWRAADIRWQLAKSDFVRSGKPPEEKYLQEIITKFPQSKQAELAAYDLLEGKLCPEWRGQAECPQKETALYEQYAHTHPQSPKAAEALYNATWRQAALVDIYRIDNNREKSEAARRKALALAQEIQNQYPQGDWKPRALDLVYKLEQKITLYGPQPE
jgi:hypothetical protein